MQSATPKSRSFPVWPLPISLAATLGIDLSFSSCPYLDVSVQGVPPITLWIHVIVTEVLSAGFPHSDIRGSKVICTSPRLFAACHVLHRLPEPRHPPCALDFFRRRFPINLSIRKRICRQTVSNRRLMVLNTLVYSFSIIARVPSFSTQRPIAGEPRVSRTFSLSCSIMSNI